MPTPLPTLPPLDEITENFALFDAWDDRFAYLIDLGKKLPPFPKQYLTDAHRVHGCQSNVWLHLDLTHPHPDTHPPTELKPRAEEPLPGGDETPDPTHAPPTLNLLATSDAHIVNGLIAILTSLYQGMTAPQAMTADADAVLQKLGLEEHLSPTRRNGLHAMIQRIRTLAATAQT